MGRSVKPKRSSRLNLIEAADMNEAVEIAKEFPWSARAASRFAAA